MVENRDGEGRSGSAARWSGFVLTVREGPDLGRQYAVESQSLTIGRAPGNDLTIQHSEIGRYHAVMVWEEDCWLVQDLSSPSGTYVNGQRITRRHPVHDGDVIGLGSAVSLQISTAQASPDATGSGAHAAPVTPEESPVSSKRAEGQPGSSHRGRSKGWLLVAMAILLGVTVLLALVLVVVLSKLDSETVVSITSPTLPRSDARAESVATEATPQVTTISAAALATAANTPSAELPPSASPTPCIDNAGFVEDVTLLDGSIVSAGELIDKTWRIQNTGTCYWRDGYRLDFVDGDDLGMVTSVLVADTTPGDTTDIAVPMFAPKAPGEYKSVWQMMNPQGEMFGAPVEINIVVAPVSAPEPSPEPEGTEALEAVESAELTEPAEPAGPTEEPEPIHFWADDETIQAGEGTTLHVLVEDVAAVWLDGDIIVGGRATKDVAPCRTTDYVLDVQLKDGTHVYQTVTIKVHGACPTPASPDLSIVGEIVPDQLQVGESVVISYTVLNQGDAVANGFDVVFTPDISATQVLTVADGLALDAGYGLRSVFSYTWSISGVFESLLWVDASNGLEESDEANNTSERMTIRVD